MKCDAWCDTFESVGHPFNTTISTTSGGTPIPTGTGNWIAQSIVSAGRVGGQSGEPGINGVIKLQCGNTKDSQIVLFKGKRDTTTTAPVFGSTPCNMIRKVSWRMYLPGPFVVDMGFRIAWSDNPVFSDWPSPFANTIGFFYDHNAPVNDVNMHCISRNAGNITDTPINPPTAQGWIDFDITQDTLGELKFWVAGVNVATHNGSSVPNIAALSPTMQIFNRRVAGTKEIWFDLASYKPVIEPCLEECEDPCEVVECMAAWGAASNNYVVGKSNKLIPNVLEATQEIALSGNQPSATNRAQILALPGQYIQMAQVPIPSYVTLCGFTSGFCNTEFLQAQFVVDGVDVNFVNFFFASEQSINVPHIDCAGNTSIVLENVQHFGKQPLLYQSGVNWRTIVMRRCGSTFNRVAPDAFLIDVSGQTTNNCDFLLEGCRFDVHALGTNGGAEQGAVRVTNIKDFRVLAGEARVNNNGICWRIVGPNSNLLMFQEGHNCNNRFPGNFPNAKSVVSDSPNIAFAFFNGPNCSFPGGIAALVPQPIYSAF